MVKSQKNGGARPTAAERREQVLAAAIVEFAENGYQAARTGDIAKRAGISQPYIYALFENKKVLFLAVQELVSERIREAFAAAWQPSDDPDRALTALGAVHQALMADRNLLRCRLQGYAATSDPEIRTRMRELYTQTFEWLTDLTGLNVETVARFNATGLLLDIGSALDLPRAYVYAPTTRS
ncbi:TetR/AcrR family transcriptional regulator [Streptomyces sp. NPDC002181]|uniref:TetR/AcrR family transcriptional regulator n=1 Tax=Streptomyces sp. NPDC002181 TaxID=3364635 RepID=UPI00368D37BE